MKIVFICGSLEPGRDGVGDYTRRLAGAIEELGHKSSIVALFDPYITEITIEKQRTGCVSITILRIPRIAGHGARYAKMREWIDEIKPGWLSLQFVPYAFHPKGLPFLLGQEIRKCLTGNRQLHIMFHETWVGVEKTTDWKPFITSLLQRLIIRRMLLLTKPAVTHTQLPVTLNRLEVIWPGVRPLPLFSNIEVVEAQEDNVQGIWRVGFFSQAAASSPIIEFLKALHRDASAENIQVEILFIGGNPVKMKKVGDALGRLGCFSNRIFYSGFLSAEKISLALQSCSLGITQVPRHALGKSGSVAAFLQHGIPVAAPVVHTGMDPLDIGFFSARLRDAVLLSTDKDALAVARTAAENARDEIGLAVITHTFIKNLSGQKFPVTGFVR